MEPARSIEELTRHNVELVTAMEEAAADLNRPGDRVANLAAAWIGSWTFIASQCVLLAAWIALNVAARARHWDPYPFDTLNLALAVQSALAAPIIMISQNRQERLAGRRNHLDLQINMLAERETTEVLRLLRLLCERSGIGVGGDEPTLEQDTKPDEIVRQIRDEDEDEAG